MIPITTTKYSILSYFLLLTMNFINLLISTELQEENDEDDDGDMETEEDDDENEEEYSDDDDMSWKVSDGMELN